MEEPETKVKRNGTVVNGPPCPGYISREGNMAACDRRAVAVVEGRRMFKCDYGHRWPRRGS